MLGLYDLTLDLFSVARHPVIGFGKVKIHVVTAFFGGLDCGM